MKIEDLVILLNNRLRDFKLSKDYAKMRGNLDRMNAADEEIIALEDTLFKLNSLVDNSKSEAVKESIFAKALTDGSTSVLGEYDITVYATDPLHEEKIMNILSKMPVMDTVEKIDSYIKKKYLSSPVTGEMIMSGAKAYSVDVRLMMAIMEQDSRFGTVGVAIRTLNPGNVGNDDDGNIRTYNSWQEGVTAVADWLSRHRGSTIVSQLPGGDSGSTTASTTPPIIDTPTTDTSTTTPPIIDTPTTDTSTTTPPIIDTPTVDTPVIDTPVIDTPAVDTPIIDTPPTIDTPTTDTTTITN